MPYHMIHFGDKSVCRSIVDAKNKVMASILAIITEQMAVHGLDRGHI